MKKRFKDSGLLRFFLAHPKSAIIIFFVMINGASFYRVFSGYQESHPEGTFERMILFNSWDDGRTFYQIMIHGYKPLPITEYREMPLYPLVCRFISPVTGRIFSLMAVSIVSSLLSVLVLYSIYRGQRISETAALGGVVFFMALRTPESLIVFVTSHLPPMETLVCIQGSEPLFLLFILLSYYFMIREDHIKAGILLALATMVRLPGCFVAFGAFIYLLGKRDMRAFLYVLSPLAVLGIFGYYRLVSGDFLAFFHASKYFYPEGALTQPYMDIIQLTIRQWSAPPKHFYDHFLYYLVFHSWFITGLVFLYKKDKRIFWLTFPSYVVAVCLKGWSHHIRYYIVLWGVNWMWFCFIFKINQRNYINGKFDQ